MPAISAVDVYSREDFVRFVRDLAHVTRTADPESANVELARYLEAVGAWTNDMPGYFGNEKRPVPDASWTLFAMILEAAVTYE